MCSRRFFKPSRFFKKFCTNFLMRAMTVLRKRKEDERGCGLPKYNTQNGVRPKTPGLFPEDFDKSFPAIPGKSFANSAILKKDAVSSLDKQRNRPESSAASTSTANTTTRTGREERHFRDACSHANNKVCRIPKPIG